METYLYGDEDQSSYSPLTNQVMNVLQYQKDESSLVQLHRQSLKLHIVTYILF